jgi:hypothetical protein
MALSATQEAFSTFFHQCPRPCVDLVFRPANQDKFFITIIVKIPVLQIISMILGSMLVLLEFAPKPLQKTPIYRSLILRAVLLLFLSVNAALFYQV